LAALFYVFFIYFGKNYVPPFPQPSGEKKVVYEWKYRDKPYSLVLNLYSSSYNFYKNLNCEERGYDCFIKFNEKDKTLNELTQSLINLGQEANLSKDGIAELSVSFIQQIPYDEEKAKKVLANEEVNTRHPYEVLYDKKGKCDEKSFLIYAILEKIGYGTALFLYPQFKHMAAGISCPINYSTGRSGYCVIETTAVARIGVDVLSIDEKGKAQIGVSLGYYSSDPLNFSLPLEGEIIEKKEGNIYTPKEVAEIKKEIEEKSRLLKSLKSEIDLKYSKLSEMKKKLDYYLLIGEYKSYNALVPPYNNLLSEINHLIEKYNDNVNIYNSLWKQYYW